MGGLGIEIRKTSELFAYPGYNCVPSISNYKVLHFGRRRSAEVVSADEVGTNVPCIEAAFGCPVGFGNNTVGARRPVNLRGRHYEILKLKMPKRMVIETRHDGHATMQAMRQLADLRVVEKRGAPDC